ncbi:MAG: glycosyltransferase family 4 protein [Anaerolineae bacterium]
MTSDHPAAPVRVLRIIARLNVGGPAIHVALLTAGLRDGVFHSELVAGRLNPGEGDMSYLARRLGVEPIILPTMQREINPLGDLRTLWHLVRLMRRYRPHVVHTHTAKAGFVGRFAALLVGVPAIVHTFHGHVFYGYFGRLKTGLFLWLERLSARYSDVILTLSEGLRRELIAYRIAPPEKIRVIPLGFDLTPFADLDAVRGRFRAGLGLSTGTPLVGIIGRLVPVKNHELFLQAARQVHAAVPEARFIVIGDGERRAALEQMTHDLGLDDRVIFTGWRQDLPAIYADLSLLVISSHNEGTPVSLIEAMACGVPVVSTAVGGVPDLLQGGRLGALVQPGDVDGLANAIIAALLADPTDQVEQAREQVWQQYDGQRLAADMRALYGEILARKGAWPQEDAGDIPVRSL